MSKTIESATALMYAQRNKGIPKYGQPIEDAGLSAAELIQHAREEMADGSVYLAQLAEQHEQELQRAYYRGMDVLMTAISDVGYASYLSTQFIGDLHGRLRGNVVPMPVRGFVQPTLADAWFAGKVNLVQVCRTKTHPFTQPIEVQP